MNTEGMNGANDWRRSAMLRNFLEIGFRWRRLMIGTFVALFLAVIGVALLLPTRYESQMKILVRRDRADSVVSPNREPAFELRTFVTQEELESEAELLKSRDLLAKVVVACDLHKSMTKSIWDMFSRDSANLRDEQKIGRAALALERNLSVEPIKRTNLISVSYRANDPQMAARVLNTLASLYLDKHLALHRVPGAFEFFNQQVEEYRKGLSNAQAQLAEFGRKEGVVSPPLEKEVAVRRLADFEAASKEARAAMVETRQRIRTIESQLASLPPRQTTQVRVSDNPQLMERMKSTLLELELRRTQLLTKFAPSYRLVQEVDAQIAQARGAIAAAEKAPLRDETTDRDPTYESLRAELARARTDLAAQEARSAAMAGLVRTYRAETQRLDRKEILQQDILRTAKAQEENYLLYLRKQEEARISDALDRQRISNVVVAQAATVPLTPRSGRLIVIVFGTLFAGFASVMLAFAADYWDPYFRTPAEVESFLGSPVVAAIPRNR